MATYINPEERATIIAAVKNGEMTISNAAKKFTITERTVKDWLRSGTKKGQASRGELSKLKQENQMLRATIRKAREGLILRNSR